MKRDILGLNTRRTDMKKYDQRVKHFIKQVGTLSQTYHLPNTNKALTMLLEEMSAEKGFTRHDGSDYFVHPIAVAQVALDFQLVSRRMRAGKVDEADNLLAGCLLHDILEDVEHIGKTEFVETYGYNLYQIVDNVTKRDGEPIEKYHERVSSNELSAVIKMLDRLNNVMTLSQSSSKHREKQVIETREHYIPLCKELRSHYWTDAPFYWQAYLFMDSILSEIQRANDAENALAEALSHLHPDAPTHGRNA